MNYTKRKPALEEGKEYGETVSARQAYSTSMVQMDSEGGKNKTGEQRRGPRDQERLYCFLSSRVWEIKNFGFLSSISPSVRPRIK